MKKIILILATLALIVSAVYAQEPSERTKNLIEIYLSSLSEPNLGVRKSVLKYLNDLKVEYPDYDMDEFNDYLTSRIMRQSTDAWKSCLTSENRGVRHSTLLILVRFKSQFPQLNMSTFNDVLEKMSKSDPEKHLRIDAQIALIYLNDPVIATSIPIVDETAPANAFTQIHLGMEKEFMEDVDSQ